MYSLLLQRLSLSYPPKLSRSSEVLTKEKARDGRKNLSGGNLAKKIDCPVPLLTILQYKIDEVIHSEFLSKKQDNSDDYED